MRPALVPLLLLGVRALENQNTNYGDDDSLDLDNGLRPQFEVCSPGHQKYVITWFDSLVGKEACSETCLTEEWGEYYNSFDAEFLPGDCRKMGFMLPVNSAYSSYVSILPAYDVYWV